MKGTILKTWKKNKWLQGIYKSPKSQRLARFLSSWELELFVFLDECNLVRNWESEAIKIPYRYRGTWKRYLPDVLINNNLLVEIKPITQIGYSMNKAKFEAAISFCKNKGWRFQIWDKNLISNKIYLMEQVKKVEKKSKI
jgi:hypothetical protein